MLRQYHYNVILFQAADVNGDKKLSRKEYYAFSHPEENPDIMRETVIQSVFDSKDKNGDGKVDFQEYSGGRGDRTVISNKHWT